MRVVENLALAPFSAPIYTRALSASSYYQEHLVIQNIAHGTYAVYIDLQATPAVGANIAFGLGDAVAYRYDDPSWKFRVENTGGTWVAMTVLPEHDTTQYPHLWMRMRNERKATTVTLRGFRIHEENVRSDIWIPAHADLTPEQVALLPPYGEYNEIKSF